VLAKLFERRSRVAWEPVFYDCVFVMHGRDFLYRVLSPLKLRGGVRPAFWSPSLLVADFQLSKYSSMISVFSVIGHGGWQLMGGEGM
jgi:hypothetical protein